MIETRGLETEESFPAEEASFWKKAAVLNYIYAKRHGYNFTYIHVNDFPPGFENFSAQALKPFVLHEEVLAASKATQPCLWGLFLDSDAVVLAPFDSMLKNISAQLGGPTSLDDTSAVLELEDGTTSDAFLNSGVIIFRYERAGDLFSEWVSEQQKPENMMLRSAWPAEQGVLEQLLQVVSRDPHPRKVCSSTCRDKVGLVQPRTMNSPNGTFVRHIWSGPGVELRKTLYDSMLLESGINLSASDFNATLSEIKGGNYAAYQSIPTPPSLLAMLQAL